MGTDIVNDKRSELTTTNLELTTTWTTITTKTTRPLATLSPLNVVIVVIVVVKRSPEDERKSVYGYEVKSPQFACFQFLQKRRKP